MFKSIEGSDELRIWWSTLRSSMLYLCWDNEVIRRRENPGIFYKNSLPSGNDKYKQVEINTFSQCFAMFDPSSNILHSLFYPQTTISDADKKFLRNFSKAEKKPTI